ncbi:MAG TPA: hypothetical protein DCS67_03665 [Clostridiales bacterium UBA8960]|jgi:hypothetical protein|nr:hypothetical protein [Clostridiales bacterium UBA8960]
MELKSNNFLISINRRENHSWQGTIQWLETGKKLHFRSEMEMLKLMSDAILTEEDETFRDWDDAPLIQLARSNQK